MLSILSKDIPGVFSLLLALWLSNLLVANNSTFSCEVQKLLIVT